MNFLPFFLFVALRRIVQKMTGIDSIYRDSLIGPESKSDKATNVSLHKTREKLA